MNIFRTKEKESEPKSMLQRESPFSSLDEQLARDAEELLGYPMLSGQLEAQRAFQKLGIKPFTNTSAEAYQTIVYHRYEGYQRWTWFTLGKHDDNSPDGQLINRRGGEGETIPGPYLHPVPQFVLERAVQLKREIPAAQFFIRALESDPFLVMWHKGLIFYVDVWDEPSFEGRLAR